MCIENMDGDYYIPGTIPDGAEGVWKEAQASEVQNVKSGSYLMRFQSPLFHHLPSPQESTEDAVLLWAHRVMSDFNRKAPKTATAKQKAGTANGCAQRTKINPNF